MKLIALVLISGIALLSTLRAADAIGWQTKAFISGNMLFDACNSNEMAVCTAYVTGAVDTLLLAGMARDTAGAPVYICLPTNVVQEQVVDVVKNYLTAHPETRQYSASSEIEIALQNAFPCSR